MTKKEEALQALAALLAAVADDLTETLGGVAFARNPAEDMTFAQGDVAKIVLRDGSTGEPEVSLSPPAYEYEHVAQIAVAVIKEGASADSAFDAIVDALAAALDPYADQAGDPTLGGAVDHAELGGLNTDEIDEALQRDFKAALIPVTLIYTTTRPLG